MKSTKGRDWCRKLWRENKSLARRLKSAKLRHNACIEDIDYRAARGVVALLGHVMLGEYMSWLRCAGITAISMGVFIVSRTNPQTTEDF